jgi:hypothetical protein
MPKATSLGSRALMRSATLSLAGNRRVDFHALGVAAAALYVAMQQVTVDRIENNLGNLRAGGVIKEDEARLLIERRKERTDSIRREGDGSGCD